MSPACAGVSAVAASNEQVKAPAKARVFMAILPSSPVRHGPAINCLLLASCLSANAVPSRWSVVPCTIWGQYPSLHGRAEDREPGACDGGLLSSGFHVVGIATVGRRPRPHQRVQDVSSFSSIEKISPASTLTLRTRQERPLTSLSFASYIPGANPVIRRRSSGSTVPSL